MLKFREKLKEEKEEDMAVYTYLSKEDINNIAKEYDLVVYSFEGIPEGILNSNYLLNTDRGRFILRVLEGNRSFESEKEELDFLLELNKIIPCTIPCETKFGETLIRYNNKLMSLFYYIDGEKIEEITTDYLKEIGILLGKLHKFSENKVISRKTRIDENYYFKKLNLSSVNIPKADIDEISKLYNKLSKIDFTSLPKGIIHNDIFPDNVFVKDGKIVGILDFNDATTAPFIFDIGIVINFWIRIKRFDSIQERECIKIFLDAYESIRKLTSKERELLDMGILKMALAFILVRIDRLIVRKEENALIEEKSYKELMLLLKYF